MQIIRISLSKLISYVLYIAPILIPVICVIIVWHHPSKFIAFAETGIPLYNPELTLTKYSSVWFNEQLGYLNPFFYQSVPFLYIIENLSKIGLTSSVIQLILFLSLAIVPIATIPLLIRELLGNKTRAIELLSAGFYFFNLFALTQVWQRFLYALLFLWSYTPLFLLLWVLWVKKGKAVYLVVFALTNILFSAVFGLIPSVFTLWVPALLYLLYELIVQKNKSALGKSLLAIIVWLLVSSWWILPIWNTRNIQGYADLKSNDNLSSLVEVSKYYDNRDILTLKQKYYLERDSLIRSHYQRKSTYYIPYLILGVVILGVYVSRRYKISLYLISLFLLSWFLVKAANPPFGKEFYSFVYNISPVFQSIRNPYEKLGILFLLSYSIFFGIGSNYIVEKLKKLKYVFVGTLVFLVFYLQVLPMWKGWVYDPSNYLSVPTYYKQANELISKSDARIFHMPYFNGAGINYSWGYSGEEPSFYLFDRPSISALTSVNSVDMFYLKLQKYIDRPNFTHLLDVMNVSNVILHKDIVLSGFHPFNYQKSLEYITSWNDVDRVTEVGDLTIYELTDKKSDWIYTITRSEEICSLDEMMDKMAQDEFDVSKTAFVPCNSNDKNLIVNSDQKIDVSFVRTAKNSYKITVNNSTSPYLLIFSSQFHPFWVLTIDNQAVLNHTKVNGYANGWMVDKIGSYDLELSFEI